MFIQRKAFNVAVCFYSLSYNNEYSDTLFVGIILWDRDKANQRDHYWSCWQWDGDRNLLGVPQGLVLRYSSFKFKLKFCPRTNFGIIYCFVGKLTYLERIIEYGPFSIGLFNTPCFLYKILNKYCFQRFLGVIVALSRNY